MKGLIFFLCLGIGGFALKAQSQELVYVHTDKQLYVSGETIWMSLYCLEPASQTLSKISAIAYLELLDKEARPVLQARIPLTKSRGQAQFLITPEIPSAVYYLRAYTSWMRNQHAEGFFELPIAIVNPALPPVLSEKAVPAIEGAMEENNSQSEEILSSHQVYGRRQRLELNIEGINAPASVSVSVYKIQSRPELQPKAWFFQPKSLESELVNFKTQDADNEFEEFGPRFYPPEMKAPFIRGKITGSLPSQLNLAFAGPSADLYSVPIQADGRFQLEVSPYIRQTEMFFWVNGDTLSEDQISLQSSFINQPIEQVYNFPSQDWRELIEFYHRNIQVGHLYAEQSHIRGLSFYPTPNPLRYTSFYDQPEVTYRLDEYTRFPSLGEVFLEYVNRAQKRRIGQKRYFYVWDEYQNLYSTANSLVFDTAALTLVDGFPILDPEIIWDLDVFQIEQIDIIAKQYFAGDQAYSGIINFQTYKGNFGSSNRQAYVLPKPYLPLQEPRQYYAPDYAADTTFSSRIPDFRTTLYWNPMWEIRAGENKLTFYTGDDVGWYQIEVHGLTNEGRIVRGMAWFEVEKEGGTTEPLRIPISQGEAIKSEPDSKFKASQVYENNFGPKQLLKNGKVYGYYYNQVDGRHFISDSIGSLLYEGSIFTQVDLHYDMFNDLVFVRNMQAGGQHHLILNQSKVKAFELGGQVFVHLQQTPDPLMKPGIYLKAFDQEGIRLYVKKRLDLDENTGTPGGQQAEFVLADVHYLLTETGCHIVRRKKDLYEVLGEERVKSLIKAERLRFTQGKEVFTGQLVQLLALWD